MDISTIAPGCYHLQGPQEAALLGCPPEVLKILLREKKKIPHVAVLPDVPHKDGISQMALEFLGYWFLFVEQGYQGGKRFRVLGTRAMCKRLHEILRVTLLGPTRQEMKHWGLGKSRADTLARMSDGMALRKDGKVQPIEDLFEFVHFPDRETKEGTPLFAQGDEIRVRRLGDNRFEVQSPEGRKEIDLNFEGEQLPPLVDLSGEVEKPEKLRVKTLGCYSGFDPEGPTTGLVMWVNGNGFLVDVPAGIRRYLKQVGAAKDQLTAVIQTHVHDDHSCLSELLISEHALTLISTREIYESAVLKAAHILGEPVEMVKSLVKFVEVTPGKTYQMYGATWEFFYTVHPIPTIGFRVTVLDEEGKPHTVLHSSDTCHFKALARLAEEGAVSAPHAERMRNLVRGDEALAMLDAGGGLIHGEPSDWDPFIEKYPKTEFLFYHVNPSKVDPKYQVARPGWGRTYLSLKQFQQSTYTGIIRALRLFEAKDPAWTNVLLAQGKVEEFPIHHEVVRRGEGGDSFYFVLNGTLDVLGSEKGSEILLATLESGDFFGERSVINAEASGATVVSRTPVILFKLRGDLFLEFLETNNLKESFNSLWKRRPLISSVAVFRDLDPTARHEISLLARSQNFKKGELIVRQGSKTDDFFVISSGTVEIFRKNESGRLVFSTTIKAGNFFGENVAMGYVDKRNASVKALNEVKCLVLPGKELRDLALRMPILRHQLHVEMKRRGVESKVLEKATPPPTEVTPLGHDPKA